MAALRHLCQTGFHDLVGAHALDGSCPSSDGPGRGFSRPEMVFSVVDLPAPLAPIRVTISPSFTVKETPLTAWIAVIHVDVIDFQHAAIAQPSFLPR